MSASPTSPHLTAYGERAEPHNVSSGEQRMWGAVILQAFIDACWVDANPNGKPTEKISLLSWVVQRRTANRIRDEAIFWLTLDNPDFSRVCEYAGMEPSIVRRWAKRIMESNSEDKAKWATADLSLHDLRAAGELRAGS